MKKLYWVVMVLVCFGIFAVLKDASAQDADADSEKKEAMEEQEPAEPAQDILNVNAAPLEVLVELPNMTPELAERVLAGRPYAEKEELLQVEGVDEALLESWGEFIEVKKLNLNGATLLELTMLPDVTPELAKAIIKNRPFRMPEELLLLDNVDEESFKRLSEWVEAKPVENKRETRGWKNKKRQFPNRAHKKTPEDKEKPRDATD